MEYVVIGIIVVIAVVLGGVLWWKGMKNKKLLEANVILKQESKLNSSKLSEDDMNRLMIQLEQLPIEAISDERNLMEITDSKILARVNNLVPALFQGGNAAANAVQASGKVLYQAVIPAGAKLAKSQDMAGAVRGIYHGAEGVSGHANLVAVNNTANVAANAAAAAMGVASMVVGQYYMTQINAELSEISEGITKISDFQDNEYKSKVFALVAQIQKAAKFQVNILDNDELRISEIANLNNWEQECIQLLGQANLTIAGFSKKNDLDYDEYEKELGEAQNWFIYQKTLMEVMSKIAELKHTLHLGAVSREQCGALLPIYSKQVQDALNQLCSWHQVQVEKFKINVEESNRKRIGFDSFFHTIPGWINEKNRYRSVSENTVKKIVDQTNRYDIPQKTDMIDLFQEDVKIIAKEGKIYYLPQEAAQ
jgi:glutaredoxin-related protein